MEQTIDFVKYFKDTKIKYKICSLEFDFNFTRFISDNNWFGYEPQIIDNTIFVSPEFLAIAEKPIDEFCRYSLLPIEKKIKLLKQKLSSLCPKTSNYFSQFCKSNQIPLKTEYAILDFMIYYLPGELINATDQELDFLFNDIRNNLKKSHADKLTSFINQLSKDHRTAYHKYYKLENYIERVHEAYSENFYLSLLYHIFCPSYIEKKTMYQKAASSQSYIDTWLYISILCLCELRGTDIERIPHPKLTMDPQLVLRKIKDNSFSDEDARLTVNSITWHLTAIPLTPNKEKDVPGIDYIKFVVPESAEVHMGKLFAIAEAHFQIKVNNPNKPLIRIINTFEEISKNMGKEIGDIFIENNISIQSMNKSNLQIIFQMTKDIIGKDDGFNVRGYMLVSLARSHKGSYGEFAETSYIYLKDAKMNGFSPEFVAKEMFERGVLSFIPSLLLKMISHGEYDKIAVESQTALIQELKLSPYEIEHVIGVSQNTLIEAIKTANEIYQNNTKEDIIKLLHRIANGNAPSKQNECFCLLAAMNIPCNKQERNHCIGCENEILTKSTMSLMLSEYKRLSKEYKESANEFIRGKNYQLIKEIILPSIDEMLFCIKYLYGEDATISYKKLIHEVLNEE